MQFPQQDGNNVAPWGAPADNQQQQGAFPAVWGQADQQAPQQAFQWGQPDAGSPSASMPAASPDPAEPQQWGAPPAPPAQTQPPAQAQPPAPQGYPQQQQQQYQQQPQAQAPAPPQQQPQQQQQQQQYQQPAQGYPQYQQQQQQQQQAPPPQQQQQAGGYHQQQGGYQPPPPPQGQQQQQPQQQAFMPQGGQMQQPPNQVPSEIRRGSAPDQGAPKASPLSPVGAQRKAARPRTGGSNRIDPSQVPSPCRDLPGDTNVRPKFFTQKGVPPLAISGFTVVDEGNASPKFIRPTIHAAPAEESLLRDSHLTWSAVLCPLHEPEDQEEVVPVVTARNPPVRCKRCRAYINPLVQFTELGRSWQCVICGCPNVVQADYFSNLDAQGRRCDLNERPELVKGSVEFDVDGVEDYAPKNEDNKPVALRPQHTLFAVDVSQTTADYMPDIVASLRNSIHQMAAKTPMCRISFITYGSTLHFYNFSNPAVPQLVVPDVENPFVPLPFTLLCWLSLESDMDKIDAFLDRLLNTIDAVNETESCLGAVVKVSSMILSECGGKVVVTASRAPTCGIGAVKPREDHKLYGTDKETQLYKPMDGFWPTMAVQCAKKQISFDLVLFPTQYCELITIGQICHITNGIQSMFFNYSSEDLLRLRMTFDRSLLPEAGYSGMLRVRTSQGLRVKGYHGHFLSVDEQDMDLTAVHSGSSFLVDFAHDGKLDPKSTAYVQSALLYTTRSGRRRVRVHTLKLPVASSHTGLFRNSDLEATTAAMMYRIAHNGVNKGMKAARDTAQQQLVEMLVAYRRYCSTSSHSGQLLLPEMLKLYPLLTLAVCKSTAICAGTDVRVDERVQCIHDMLTLPIHRMIYFLYPRMYAVHNTLSHPSAGTINPQTGHVSFPVLQQLTADMVMTHGAYVLHDQQNNTVYLWVGQGVNTKFLQQLFGTEEFGAVSKDMTLWNDRVKNIVTTLQQTPNGVDRLVVVHEKLDTMEETFFKCMIEDETGQGKSSYSDWLCQLHRNINQKMS